MPIICIRVILGDELQLHIIIISMLILNKFIWLKVCLTIEQMLTQEHVGQNIHNCHLFTDTAHIKS